MLIPRARAVHPRVTRAVRQGLGMVAILLLAIAAAFAFTFVRNIGGVGTLRTLYQSWRDPGNIAFSGRVEVAIVPQAPPPWHLQDSWNDVAQFGGWWNPKNGNWPERYTPDPAATDQTFDDHDRMYILLLGVDYNHDRRGIQYTKNARTDTIIVAAVDRRANGLTLLSIPRDMQVTIPGHGTDKINAAYSLRPDGARDLTVRTVERFLGIHIDHTVVVKPYAAEHLVDALGGITIDVEKTMDYDDNWGNLHIHLKKGSQHLNGRQAVGYIRFRHDEDGDRGRMRRQQQFVNTLLSQLKRIDTLSRVEELQTAFQHDIQTTLSYEQLIDLAMLYKNFDRRKMRAISLVGHDAMLGGVYYTLPDEREKQTAVARLRNRELASARRVVRD